MSEPQVTIVVTQRERFTFTQAALDSIYEHTESPFRLIYVDGKSPAPIRRYLELQAEARQFSLVQRDHFLSPNQARNIGLAEVDTKYLVFIDNDVVLSPGWLTALVKCAEETGASIVSPLICIGTPHHENIHNGGGRIRIAEEKQGEKLIRSFSNQDEHGGTKYEGKVSQLWDQIHRGSWDYVEFHCMLVRTEVFELTGPLDEGLMSTREHIDFCMTVTRHGGTNYLEPTSIVTYVPGQPETSDLPFFMLRWSDKWHYASLKRFKDKWDLTEMKRKKPGFRRERAYIAPFVKRLRVVGSVAVLNKAVTKLLVSMDRVVNRAVSFRYDQTQESPVKDAADTPT